MKDTEQIKSEIRDFYYSETIKRDVDGWLEEGNSPRVPESRASHYFLDTKVSNALEMASLEPDNEILEVGCSFGHQTFLLTNHFRKVVAVDLTPEEIELAQRRAKHYNVSNVEFHIADAEDMSCFTDESFDGVFSFSCLRYCPNPAGALSEIHRTLRQGGRAVIDFPNRYCPWFGLVKKLIGISPHIHDRLFDLNETVKMMREAGFSRIRARHILFSTKRLPDFILPVFRLLDKVLIKIPGIRALAGIIMVSGEKHEEG